MNIDQRTLINNEMKNLLCNDPKGRHEKNGDFGYQPFIK